VYHISEICAVAFKLVPNDMLHFSEKNARYGNMEKIYDSIPDIKYSLSSKLFNANKLKIKLEAKDVLPNKPHAGCRKGRKMPFFVHGNLDL